MYHTVLAVHDSYLSYLECTEHLLCPGLGQVGIVDDQPVAHGNGVLHGMLYLRHVTPAPTGHHVNFALHTHSLGQLQDLMGGREKHLGTWGKTKMYYKQGQ